MDPSQVKVRIEGVHPEEIINRAAAKGIKIEDPEAAGKVLVLTTDYRGYKSLIALGLEQGFSLTKLGARGLLPFVQRLVRRKFFLIGFLCFCWAVYYISGLVWTIQLDGLVSIDQHEFLVQAAEFNLRKGANIRRLDLDEIEHSLYLAFPQIAWVAVERMGAKIRIRVVEREYNPLEFGAVIDIVAEYDGIIFEMMVLKGIPQVEPGMTVVKGDILIAGYRDGDNQVSAAGFVTGRVFLEGYGEATLAETEKRYTGREEQVSALRIWGRELPLSRKPRYQHYEVEESAVSIYGSQLVLIQRRYSEIMLISKTYSHQEADELARLRALIAAHGQADVQATIIKKEIENISSGPDCFGYRVLLTIETNIGCEKVQTREE